VIILGKADGQGTGDKNQRDQSHGYAYGLRL
jgi:hypothetical protein